jgi:DNA repair exonuclease SbcCD ATPase subunit
MTGADRQWAAQYEPGDIVRYARGSQAVGVKSGEYVRVNGVDRDQNLLTVERENGQQLTYDPHRLHGVSVYREAEREFSAGDRVQFTAPYRDEHIANRQLGTVQQIDAQGNLQVRLDSGHHVEFNIREHPHVDFGYAVTSHSSQGATADRVLVHVDTEQAHDQLVNSRLAYVSVSRGRNDAQIYTNDAEKLGEELSRDATLATRIEELHRQIREIQGLETSNRDTERTVQTLDAELRSSVTELERLRVEHEELAIVPCRGEGPYASCPKIRRAVEAGKKIPTLEGEVATLSIEVDVQRGSLVQIAMPSFELTRTLEGCERDRRKVDQERQRYEELRAVEARRDERVKALERLAQGRAEVTEELARKESALSAFADLDGKMQASRREIENTDRLIITDRRERDSLIARQAQIKQRQDQLEAARTRLAQVEAELGAARTEQEDYSYLSRVFGPDEIQLCEIQAAGPQVSTLVNSLLEGCFDNKFEIRFRTQRPKADGRGMVDDFDIEVRNKNLDRTCLVDELSGGQFVLVNEAVNLGVAIYNMRQGESIRYETLFRDETVGALDAVNGKEYVRMLRRAMDLGGFHQVIFICHTPLVWELADSILSVGDGRVGVGDSEEVVTDFPISSTPPKPA